MKAYKIKSEGTEQKDHNERILFVINNQLLMLATPTQPHVFRDNYVLKRYQDAGLIEEVNLLEEQWIHPHLFKPIKQLVKEQLPLVG